MADDIVTRLRNMETRIDNLGAHEDAKTAGKAATEIERLRAELADCQRTVRALEDEPLRIERNRWRRLAHWQHHPDSSKCYNQRTCECVELDYEAMIDMEKVVDNE